MPDVPTPSYSGKGETMDDAERIEKIAAAMREFTCDRTELDFYALGAIRGYVDLVHRGDIDVVAAWDRIKAVFAAEAIVRAERQ